MPREPSEKPEHAARRWIVIALKVVVSVALMTFLLSRIDMAQLWAGARNASLVWLAIGLVVYLVNVMAAVWRWDLLLTAQRVQVPRSTLLGSFLVGLFFNNFLPSNIGGDVFRIRDSAKAAGSKTLATTVILVDRVIGVMGLVFVAAMGATLGAAAAGHGPAPIWPSWLWAGFFLATMVSAPAVLAPSGVGRLLQPLAVFHPEWIGDRIESLTGALARFRERPSALASCFLGAVFVQGSMVAFYVAVAFALHVNITPWDLAVIVPLSFIVQMLPVSLNGFGVREATFLLYFARLGLPKESALLLSLVATAVTMLFSLSGAAVYIARGREV
ncbi:MAG TPA: lysylphosphatidylglycerol synthase transmembrane domain-containing protein [Vicinamibacterales bacterium]|jgi:uncharacterized membrane protein YbhN (UPF0104 family)|nr:lysylphosphatidylglycerol synthase transmembrane domain-containing protein [Vicinamibacterales bacterium]